MYTPRSAGPKIHSYGPAQASPARRYPQFRCSAKSYNVPLPQLLLDDIHLCTRRSQLLPGSPRRSASMSSSVTNLRTRSAVFEVPRCANRLPPLAPSRAPLPSAHTPARVPLPALPYPRALDRTLITQHVLFTPTVVIVFGICLQVRNTSSCIRIKSSLAVYIFCLLLQEIRKGNLCEY